MMLDEPGIQRLDGAVAALREWQHDTAPLQLHPGDLGWYWRFGADATATAVRSWSRDGRIVAVGLLDGPTLLRLTVAPNAMQDGETARQLVADLTRVLPTGTVYVEAPTGALIHELLAAEGWSPDAPWTPLRRDLSAPVPDPGLRVAAIGPEQADEWAGVVRASFTGSTFTVERWQAMAAGLPYAEARCLLGYDDRGAAVAAAAVWSAGPGRPGLLEPLGVHGDHRGHGYGTAMSLAGAAALREMGSSSAIVCTPSSNVGAVATYKSAGFQLLPQRLDRRRDS